MCVVIAHVSCVVWGFQCSFVICGVWVSVLMCYMWIVGVIAHVSCEVWAHCPGRKVNVKADNYCLTKQIVGPLETNVVIQTWPGKKIGRLILRQDVLTYIT